MILKYSEIKQVFKLDSNFSTGVVWIAGLNKGKQAGVYRYRNFNVFVFGRTIKLDFIKYCLQTKKDVDSSSNKIENNDGELSLRTKKNPKRHILYRVFENNELLYVGISSCFEKRVSQHLRNSVWMKEHCEFLIKTQVYPDRKSLELAEIDAINNEFPKYNIALVNYKPTPQHPSVRKQRSLISIIFSKIKIVTGYIYKYK